MRDWPRREHVETLRQWPVLVELVRRIEARPDVFAGAFLIGSLSRGLGDAISDVDLVVVVEWWEAGWAARRELSAGALATFERFDDEVATIAVHSWLTPELVKVECLFAQRGSPLRLYGHVVVLVGDAGLPDEFDRRPPLQRQEVDDYAAERRDRGEIPPIEQAYADLMELLAREIRTSPPRPPNA